MPTTPMKNLLYRAALPFLAPSPHKLMTHQWEGRALNHLPYYEHLLVKHHVFGASLLLSSGTQQAAVYTSTMEPRHPSSPDMMFRVASITKMATALVTLRCVDMGMFSLDDPVAPLLPEGEKIASLRGVTVRQLLSHTSGLCDHPIVEQALRQGETFAVPLNTEGIRIGEPGAKMVYCNFGFGLLGCLLENVTGECVEELFQRLLFRPLGLRATLNASSLQEKEIMPILRVLPYHPGQEITITPLGRQPLKERDPQRHFGYTAGAMYTDAASVLRLLRFIQENGRADGTQLIHEELIGEMTTRQAATSNRTYGLGLVLLNRLSVSSSILWGHQGFAYGCVDGAFMEADTGRAVVFLNGGASEARTGKLGLVNQDVLRWALNKELPSWT